MRGLGAAALLGLLALGAGRAAADDATDYHPVGELVCSPTARSVVGSTELREMGCAYQTTFGDRLGSFTAHITRRQSDPAITAFSRIVWGVFSSKTTISGSEMNGSFTGVSPSSHVAGYVSKYGLQNTDNLRVYLQPKSSVIGEDLVNLAKTVERLELKTGQ